MTRPQPPYHDITVVEAVAPDAGRALRLAAAMAGRIFADLGATVISFTDTEQDDLALRQFLSARKAVRSYTGTGAAAVARAIGAADIALIDEKSLRTLGEDSRPLLIAALSHFGGKVAESDVPASAFTVSALGGLLNLVGDPEREPLKLAGHQEAYALGLASFCGLSGALATGKPRRTTVRANLLDAVIWLNWKAVPLSPTSDHPARAGADAEWQVLRCADGFAALVYQEPEWPRLCDAMNEPLLRAPRFATRAERLHHARELAGIIEAQFLKLTRRELHDLALKHRLPLGPVWSPIEAFDDAHNKARGFFETLPSDSGGAALAPRLPATWNGRTIAEAFAEQAISDNTVAS